MKNRHGFTIIEVSFFLAITGLLFLGVAMGVQSSIYRQRYNDSVQSFVEFLRGVYGETTNVQSNKDGRSDFAIYGKLVTFGESKTPLGVDNDGKAIFVYDVIGSIEGLGDTGASGLIKLLQERSANVYVLKGDGEGRELAGMVESYIPKWSATIQDKDKSDFKGTLLIARHPRSGDVFTFFSDSVVEVNKEGGEMFSSSWFSRKLDSFRPQQIDFCVTPDGFTGDTGRADVRINKSSSGSAGIDVIYDSDDNKCDG